jgi:ABC-2 type transport system permease protein
MAVHQLGELSRFPLSIYPLAFKAVLGFVVPFAFISIFPISFLLEAGTAPWLDLLTPLVAEYYVAVALAVFAWACAATRARATTGAPQLTLEV